ncbi:sensor histidine kinase [Streptomyces sp. MST-110588]|uniref:sensor histidine kinase n=1 Tax=Streptomyces sp. MST-110588 TaxID=2833628 RepID=UPI001F5C6FC4|nr:sensor histidine kinase [Streptomyces sp. MST-110588]UNO43082.1 sensor histidine kinase [Streptomyces sp. MST-110588]
MSEPAPRPVLVQPLGRGQLVVLDGLAALLFATVPLMLLYGRGSPADAAPDLPLWAVCLIAAGTGLPCAVRRLWPLPVFALVLTLSVLGLALGAVRDPFTAAAFALYTVALTGSRPRSVPTRVIGGLSTALLLLCTLAGTRGMWNQAPGTALVGCAVLGGAWTVGRAVRDRRAYAQRAAREFAELAVAEERLRIAREMHDIVTHSMGLITVKAAVANHVGRARPQEAYDALRVIEDIGRGALREMRYLLDAWRTEEGDADAGLAPAPGATDLDRLIDRARLAGITVRREVRGVASLPDGVALTVYRIVQEALTNVVRHAAPTHCRVAVTADGRDVRIEVRDEGRAVPAERRAAPLGDGEAGEGQLCGGHGLIGMRERVAVYGGSFTAGPLSDGGYRVRARIPYESTVRPAGRTDGHTDGEADGESGGASGEGDRRSDKEAV